MSKTPRELVRRSLFLRPGDTENISYHRGFNAPLRSPNVTKRPVDDHGSVSVHVLDFDELSGADEKDGARFEADHRHAAGFSFARVKHPFAARHQQHRSGFLYR